MDFFRLNNVYGTARSRLGRVKILSLLLLLPSVMTARTLYVAPTGSDTGTGTEASPVTLERARDLARQDPMNEDVRIVLADGVYRQTRPFVLTRADSGRNGHRVIYCAAEGARPVISGGCKLTEPWILHDAARGIYRYGKKLDFETRNLFVNGQWIYLARSHAPEQMARDHVFYWLKLLPMIGFRDESRDRSTVRFLEGLKKNGGIHRLEAVRNQRWRHFECPVSCVEGDTVYMDPVIFSNTARPNHRLHYDWVGTWSNHVTYFQNAYGLLDAPGEFYQETDGTLYMIPPAGTKNPGDCTVEAARLNQILVCEGRDADKVTQPQPGREVGGIVADKIRNIDFRGLTFACSTYTDTARLGYICSQSGHFLTGPYGKGPKSDHFASYSASVPGAVQVNSGDGIRFSDCDFRLMASNALKISYGSRNCTVEKSRFADIGGGAVYLGDTRFHSDRQPDPDTVTRAFSVGGPKPQFLPMEERERSYGNTLAYNHIERVGRQLSDCCAVWAGYESRAKIVHNTIENVPYTALQLGWGWRETGRVSHMRDNYVAWNRINRSMQLMGDGGAIYMIQAQPGTIVENNYIAHTGTDNALYLDAGLDYAIYRNNVMDCLNGKWVSANASSNHRGMILYDNWTPYTYTGRPNPYRITFEGVLSVLGENFTETSVFPAEAVQVMRNAGDRPPYELRPRNDPTGYHNYPINLARCKPAEISSGTRAAAALDGDCKAYAATDTETDPWWQTDLRICRPIRDVTLLLPDGTDASVMNNARVLLSDVPFGRRSAAEAAKLPSVRSLPLKAAPDGTFRAEAGTAARYVRVQAAGKCRLLLDEVCVSAPKAAEAVPYMKDPVSTGTSHRAKATAEYKPLTQTVSRAKPADALFEAYTDGLPLAHVFVDGTEAPADAVLRIPARLRRNEWLDSAWIDSYIDSVRRTQPQWEEYTRLTLGKLRGTPADIRDGLRMGLRGTYAAQLPLGTHTLEFIFDNGMSLRAAVKVTD